MIDRPDSSSMCSYAYILELVFSIIGKIRECRGWSDPARGQPGAAFLAEACRSDFRWKRSRSDIILLACCARRIVIGGGAEPPGGTISHRGACELYRRKLYTAAV